MPHVAQPLNLAGDTASRGVVSIGLPAVAVAVGAARFAEQRTNPRSTQQSLRPVVDRDACFIEASLVASGQRGGGRICRAMPSPSFTDERRTVSYVSSMPAAASGSQIRYGVEFSASL